MIEKVPAGTPASSNTPRVSVTAVGGFASVPFNVIRTRCSGWPVAAAVTLPRTIALAGGCGAASRGDIAWRVAAGVCPPSFAAPAADIAAASMSAQRKVMRARSSRRTASHSRSNVPPACARATG